MNSGSGVNLETMLAEDLGQLGRYQLRAMAALLVMSAIAALGTTEYLFTTARIPTRCLIPECDNLEIVEFSPEWIQNVVPTTSSGYDNCLRFANNTISLDITNNTCPATIFNRNVTESCKQYVYENTNTVVYDFDLACDEWRRTIIGSVQTLGAFVALPLTGFVSDRWGRRIALSFNAFNTAWIGLLRYWTDTYYGFLISEFFESFLGSGAFSCIYILVMELIGPKYRVMAGATISSFFSVGQIVVALVAWRVLNWRLLTLSLYAPQLIAITYYWLVPESLRWYQAKGQYEKAEAAIRKIARINRKELSHKTLEALRAAYSEKQPEKVDKSKEWLIVEVIKNKPILKRCLISPFWWITTTFVYYGLSINAVNIISGNIYFNYMAVAAVEAPGFWTAVLLIGRVGRKPVLTGAYWVCAICQLAYIFISQDLFGVSLAVYLVGKFCIAIVTTAMYVYTAELYPTEYRHSLFAFSSMLGRIGSILAPLTPALGASTWEWLPFALFGIMALVAGALVLLTPETLGRPLPDTMQEAAEMK